MLSLSDAELAAVMAPPSRNGEEPHALRHGPVDVTGTGLTKDKAPSKPAMARRGL